MVICADPRTYWGLWTQNMAQMQEMPSTNLEENKMNLLSIKIVKKAILISEEKCPLDENEK